MPEKVPQYNYTLKTQQSAASYNLAITGLYIYVELLICILFKQHTATTVP